MWSPQPPAEPPLPSGYFGSDIGSNEGHHHLHMFLSNIPLSTTHREHPGLQEAAPAAEDALEDADDSLQNHA